LRRRLCWLYSHSLQKPTARDFRRRFANAPQLDCRVHTRLSAFERYADEVALSPDKATVASCAKFVEAQLKVQRHR